MNRLRINLIALCSIVFAGATSMSGQIGRGTITGIVRDPTGAAAASVAVTAVNSATSVVFETTTNDGGAYTIGALPPGQYTVRFKAPGFREAVRQNVALDSGTIARVDPTLELGAVSDQVLVTTESAVA
jgi:hypothetical protein